MRPQAFSSVLVRFPASLDTWNGGTSSAINCGGERRPISLINHCPPLTSILLSSLCFVTVVLGAVHPSPKEQSAGQLCTIGRPQTLGQFIPF